LSYTNDDAPRQRRPVSQHVAALPRQVTRCRKTHVAARHHHPPSSCIGIF